MPNFSSQPSNTGDLLNCLSECPQRYKTGVITIMLHIAFKISSSPILFYLEIARIKQLFTNNNYPITVINECIEKFMNKRQFNNINSTEVNKEEVLNYSL